MMMKMYISYFFQRRLLKALNNKVFGLFLFSCCITAAYASPSEGYQVATIEAEPYTQVIQRTGKVDFARVVNLSFKTAGFLTELNVDEGEVFKKINCLLP